MRAVMSPLLTLIACAFLVLFPAESEAGVSFHPLVREGSRGGGNKKPSARREVYAGVMDTDTKGNDDVGRWMDSSPSQPGRADSARSGDIQDVLLQALAYLIQAQGE